MNWDGGDRLWWPEVVFLVSRENSWTLGEEEEMEKKKENEKEKEKAKAKE